MGEQCTVWATESDLRGFRYLVGLRTVLWYVWPLRCIVVHSGINMSSSSMLVVALCSASRLLSIHSLHQLFTSAKSDYDRRLVSYNTMDSSTVQVACRQLKHIKIRLGFIHICDLELSLT